MNNEVYGAVSDAIRALKEWNDTDSYDSATDAGEMADELARALDNLVVALAADEPEIADEYRAAGLWEG